MKVPKAALGLGVELKPRRGRTHALSASPSSISPFPPKVINNFHIRSCGHALGMSVQPSDACNRSQSAWKTSWSHPSLSRPSHVLTAPSLSICSVRSASGVFYSLSVLGVRRVVPILFKRNKKKPQPVPCVVGLVGNWQHLKLPGCTTSSQRPGAAETPDQLQLTRPIKSLINVNQHAVPAPAPLPSHKKKQPLTIGNFASS